MEARALAAPAILFTVVAAGCGAGSPSVASVASSVTTAATSSNGGAPTGSGGSTPAPRSGGNTFINVGNATDGTKFAACMRKHGLPRFPDPNAQGSIEFSFAALGLNRNSPKFRSAMHACRTLLPNGLAPPTPAQLAQVQQQLLAFSTCMRAHGLGDFPDPSGGSLPHIQPSGDLDPNSLQFQAAYAACKGDVPASLPDKALGGLAGGGG
jgi:hypothetical protein